MLEKMSKYINKYMIFAVIIIGCIFRLIYIGRVPGDSIYFQDEAYSAYEAYSMLHYGIDTHGYHHPVYLKAMGSGMSAVQSYCQMFWIKILGFGPIAVRLPQAILGCITLVFFYLLLKEFAEERIVFWSTFVLAISPWHITMSRWGLASNYFFGFITIAMYLIISSRNRTWRTLLAAVITGVAFYSSASPWIVMPFLIFGTVIYLYTNKEMNRKSIIIYSSALFIIVFPLLLFLAVNGGIIPEIKTGFISIPRIDHFIFEKIRPSLSNVGRMLSFFWSQDDKVLWDSVAKYGIYYLFSNVFLIIGIVSSLLKRNKKNIIIWLWLVCGILLGFFIEADFQSLNILFVPLFYFVGIGIVSVIGFFEKYKTIDACAVALIYGVACVSFVGFYYTDYNVMMMRELPDGAEEAIKFAQQYNGTIHINDISYPSVLCYSKYPVDKFVNTVVYKDEKAEILEPVSYEGYDYTEYTGSAPVSGDAYICSVNNPKVVQWLAAQDMSIAQFGKYYLGVAN